jgi:hypothetical protein
MTAPAPADTIKSVGGVKFSASEEKEWRVPERTLCSTDYFVRNGVATRPAANDLWSNADIINATERPKGACDARGSDRYGTNHRSYKTLSKFLHIIDIGILT